MLQVNHEADDQHLLQSVLQKHCKDFKLMSYQTNEVNAYIQAYYHVRLKKSDSHPELVDELKALETTRSVNLFFDDIEPRL